MVSLDTNVLQYRMFNKDDFLLESIVQLIWLPVRISIPFQYIKTSNKDFLFSKLVSFLQSEFDFLLLYKNLNSFFLSISHLDSYEF